MTLQQVSEVSVETGLAEKPQHVEMINSKSWRGKVTSPSAFWRANFGIQNKIALHNSLVILLQALSFV